MDPNLMGGPFMIIEQVVSDTTIGHVSVLNSRAKTTGVDLHTVFDRLAPNEKQRTVEDYARIIQKLSLVRFSSIGSLEREQNGSYKVVALSAPRSHAEARRTLATNAIASRPYRSTREWLDTIERENKLLLEQYPEQLGSRSRPEEETRQKHAAAKLASEGMIRLIPHVAQSGGLSSIFCLWHIDLHGRNILVCPSGPDAGKIVSIIDWENAGMFPIWRLVDPPEWFASNRAREPRPNQEFLRYLQLFQNEITRLDTEGLLRSALQSKYDFLRQVASAATAPWQNIDQRNACIAAFQAQQAQQQALLAQQQAQQQAQQPQQKQARKPDTQRGQSGYATDSAVKPRARTRSLFGRR
ncbi:hypothetical protein CALVIDRAFT_541334 [Calocera viscosa TUFC12733]|uniref:Aminoglycoside phosphotransferase domain-containing protein n=1 Tax=Calocera viscosa (strain TUFC12733) TaxID=1330018 RepID=A0A167HUA4_CALVF|nr:hypothetical protein CALVIDRAFT_541334 [Calocera viscosa TUFC12733]